MRPFVLFLSASLIATAAWAGADFGARNPAPIAPMSGMILYRDARYGFTIAYPPHWAVNAAFRRDIGPVIHGVSFTVSAEVTQGTNLASDTKLSVEHVDGRCHAGRFLDSPTDEHDVTDGAHGYSMASTQDAGAGNRYEETVYAFAHGGTCFGIRYFIHYGAIQNYDPGTVKAFDHDALTAAFDRMRRSLSFNR
ncbi:MAG TPA: hypothetical protein VGG48_15255 [Rhizomicrobium sp.]|jgi:hypothetical protein